MKRRKSWWVHVNMDVVCLLSLITEHIFLCSRFTVLDIIQSEVRCCHLLTKRVRRESVWVVLTHVLSSPITINILSLQRLTNYTPVRFTLITHTMLNLIKTSDTFLQTLFKSFVVFVYHHVNTWYECEPFHHHLHCQNKLTLVQMKTWRFSCLHEACLTFHPGHSESCCWSCQSWVQGEI